MNLRKPTRRLVSNRESAMNSNYSLLLASFITAVFVSVLFSSPTGAEAQKKADSRILITIKRETSLGGCPSYSAQIYADGTVVYRGDDFVKIKGERRHKVDETKVLELVRAFERIDYFSLKDKYEVDANGRSSTDQPRTTTSISLNGRYKRVIDYYCAPKELVALEDLIDKLAGLYEYIGPL